MPAVAVRCSIAWAIPLCVGYAMCCGRGVQGMAMRWFAEGMVAERRKGVWEKFIPRWNELGVVRVRKLT